MAPYRNRQQGPADTPLRKNPNALFLMVLLGLATAMAAVTSVEGALRHGHGIPWDTLVAGRLADWYTCAVFVPALYWVTARLPLGGKRWRAALAVHLIATASASAFKFVLYVPLRFAIEPGYERTILEALSADFLGKLMFFWAVTGILHALYFYRQAALEGPRTNPPSGMIEGSEGSGRLAVRDGRGIRLLSWNEIDWIEAQGNYALIHAGPGRYLVRETLTSLAGRVGGKLVRVHRSAIVNLAHVVRADRVANGRLLLTMRDGTVVSSGRSYARRLRGEIV